MNSRSRTMPLAHPRRRLPAGAPPTTATPISIGTRALNRRGTVAKVLLGLLIVLGAAGGVLAWQGKIFNTAGADEPKNLVFEAVKKGPLEITITERGNLESAMNSTIVCMVEGEAGVGILEIVEEGKLVKKGDIVVKLDASNL
ncbi:MAG TPA: hypothetical protein VGH74_12360, partial [Planctomycetaceae bacterium]